MLWVLLIYSVPSEPTRKRAFIWRELKKAGAVYLRDGVCVLPDGPDTRHALQAVAATVREYEGQATVLEGARLEDETAARLMAQAQTARQSEYAAVVEAAEQLLGHLRRETEHREFTEHELEVLEADLVKLYRWYDQIRARDYVGTGVDRRPSETLAECTEALARFLDETFARAEAAR